MSTLAPSPERTTVLATAGLMSQPWITWMRDLRTGVLGTADALRGVLTTVTLMEATTPVVQVRQSYVAQAAAIPNVPVWASPTADLYRVNWYMHTTQLATVSSYWSFILRWTDAGVACAFASATFSGNDLNDKGTGVWLIHVDAGTSIYVETAYGSVGATPMQYRTDVLVEQMPVGP